MNRRECRQDALTLARLDHPCSIAVYDFGKTADDDFYFVMEFVDGVAIREYIQQNGGKLPANSALSIVAHVLDGLACLHAQGILHRDINQAKDRFSRAEDFRAALDRILIVPLPNRDGTGAVRVRLVKQPLDLKGTGPVNGTSVTPARFPERNIPHRSGAVF